MEQWRSDTGQLVYVHSRQVCMPPCPIHAPSLHALVNAKRHWRDDREIMERICDHGIGHPDPDEIKLWLDEDSGVHGCDGCCRKDRDESENVAGT